jgi:hypothetical protein
VRCIFNEAGVTKSPLDGGLIDSTYRGSASGPGTWLPAGHDVLGVDGFNQFICDKQRWRRVSREVFGLECDFADRMKRPPFGIECAASRKAAASKLASTCEEGPSVPNLGSRASAKGASTATTRAVSTGSIFSMSSTDAFMDIHADLYFQRRQTL